MDRDGEYSKILINRQIKTKLKKSKKKNNFVITIYIILIILLIYFIIFIIKNSNDIKKIEKNEYKNETFFPKIKNNEYKSEIFNNLHINDKIKIIRMFTNNNKYLYEKYEKCLTEERDNLKCIYHLLAPKKVVGKERVLIGIKKDSSYVLLNDFENIKIAYSFGIDGDAIFDEDLAKRNIDVYMYDHTINSLPLNHSKFHWKKIGICGNSERNEQLKTLEDLIIENGHTSEMNMILKMDIEYAEWTALKDSSEKILNQFKYITLEYHLSKPQSDLDLYYDVLKKLHKTHQPFYLHCNGHYKVIIFRNNIYCKTLEVSYVIRKDTQFTKDDSIYPIMEFDYSEIKNDVNREINLNILKLFDF